MKKQDREQEESIERLRTWIKEGDTLKIDTRTGEYLERVAQ